MARAKAAFGSRGLKVPADVLQAVDEWDRSDWKSATEIARHEAAHFRAADSSLMQAAT